MEILRKQGEKITRPDITILPNLVSAVVAAFNISEKVVLLVLGVKALNQGTIGVPVVDNLIDKYME